jgi:hypothetical protein
MNQMDNLVSIYHGGSMKRDHYGYVEFFRCKACLCYSIRSLHLVSWLQGLGRSYIAMEMMMMMASQLRVYFT